jgi:hypothetical protein
MGVTPSQHEHVLAGTIRVSLAERPGVTVESPRECLDGGTSIALAGRIGGTPDTLPELRNRLSAEAARALLIRLCIHPRR